MEQKIRVLHILGTLKRGGAQAVLLNLYRKFDRTKIQFDFIVQTPVKYDLEDEIKNLGGKIHRVSKYNGINHLLYKKTWNDFFKKHPEYKIIHGHAGSTASIYLKIARKYGLTTIAHSHTTSSGVGLKSIVKNILQYPIRYIADYKFACSRAAGEWLFGKNACERDNFMILNNAIDAKKYIYNEDVRNTKRKELSCDDKFVIGHVGRFLPVKNHEFIIDVFYKIHKRNNNAILLLTGDGVLKSHILNKVKKLGLDDNVIFTGIRSDIPELLQVIDIFLFPSLYEGLPVTLIEAQASGLKCIASDTITEEVKITDNVEFISLDKSPVYWAEQVLTYENGYERKNTYAKIYDAGYDVSENAKWLQEFYLKEYSKLK